MCGIAGFLSTQDKADFVGILERMLTRIKHRGPDESGVYVNENFAMGSVRLSIQDIKTGGMPLSNEHGNLWIVFNGEIFNFIELREELLKKGHTFHTTGDTEVIVHLYQEYGTDFLNKLNGQFAIAIWDKSKRELLLARDRIGIRPLYFFNKNGEFLFSSEIKSFLEYPDFKFEISPKVISQYFTFWTSINNETIFKDVYQLPPGSFMIVNDREVKIQNFWEIPIMNPLEGNQKNIDVCSEELDALLEDSVRIRLRADVPVAAYLSGGLDSTITTSYIHNINKDNLRTFSIGFNEIEFDETGYQILASKHFETLHTAVKIDNNAISENFESAIWHAEAPLLRTSPVPMMNLSKVVRENGIKVVITGEGADELFGGYNIFKEAKIRHFWSKDIDSKYRPLLLKRLYPYLPLFNNTNTTALKLFFGYKLTDTNSPIYSHLIRWNNTSRIKNYFSDDLKSETKQYDPIDSYLSFLGDKLNSSDYLSKASYIEMNLFLSGYLLSSQGDRMSMANSVEGRYPFLDHRVIEFATSLPSDFKLKGLNEKYLLKKIAKGRIPEEIIKRSKQAYRAPINDVIWGNSIPDRFRQLLDGSLIEAFGLFDPVMVNKLIEKFKNGLRVAETDRMALTGVLSIQMLFDLFVNRSRGPLRESEIIKLDKIIID